MVIKEITRGLLYKLKRKPYLFKAYNGVIVEEIRRNTDAAFFYGYYDHSPERNGKILFHEMQGDTVSVVVGDFQKGTEIMGVSKAFNWQMGTRAMWIDDDTIAYNDFDGNKYVCNFYSLSQKKKVKTYVKPLQDYSSKGYFLGVNYQRLRSYAKEYGYYCLPELSDAEFDDYGYDGIWKVDVNTGDVELILSIECVIECMREPRFASGQHFVNHIMISPNGESFIFIHRYYVGKKRYDRLMCYDFMELKCLLNDPMQSHYCWLDDRHVFGYGGYKGRNEFHTVDVKTGEVEICEELTRIHPKDGHPTTYGNWVVVDSYPNLSRMQELTAFNLKTKEHIKLLEVFHDLKLKGFNRCDLHPRFSDDGKRIYFDTIFSGKRELCCIDVSNVIS